MWQYLSNHLLERVPHALVRSRRGLDEHRTVLLGESEAVVPRYRSVRRVDLIAHNHLGHVVPRAVYFQLVQPGLELLEGVLFRNVVHENCALCISEENSMEFSSNF